MRRCQGKITLVLDNDIAEIFTDEIKRMAQEQANQDISDRVARHYLQECLENYFNIGHRFRQRPERLVGTVYVPVEVEELGGKCSPGVWFSDSDWARREAKIARLELVAAAAREVVGTSRHGAEDGWEEIVVLERVLDKEG